MREVEAYEWFVGMHMIVDIYEISCERYALTLMAAMSAGTLVIQETRTSGLEWKLFLL